MNGIEEKKMQIDSTFNIHNLKLTLLHGLGWMHTVELKSGIEKIYNWYKENN